MPSVRITVMRPLPGYREELLDTLGELDDALAGKPGLLQSTIISDSGVSDVGLVGRVSVWTSGERANEEAQDPKVLAIRARLMSLAAERPVDTLFDVESNWPEVIVGPEPSLAPVGA